MNIEEMYNQRKNFHIALSSTARGGLGCLVLIGLICFAAGFLIGEEMRAWGSFLLNLMFFFSLALGGIAFGHMQDVIAASWGRPVKRLHEAFGSFLVPAVGLFFLFFACIKLGFLRADRVYSWIQDPASIASFHGKSFWLQPDFMLFRVSIALLVMLALSRWHRAKILAPDHALDAGKLSEAKRIGIASRHSLQYWSAPMLAAQAVLYSLVTFDLLMSLAPTWFSTLWAGLCFSIMMQVLFALILLFMFGLRKHSLGQYYGRQQFHDLGKLMFGFTAFYAYLVYSHVLTYWYTNIPEETSYFLTRLREPWCIFTILSPLLSFLIPFIVMMPRAAKWTGWVAVPMCLLVVVSQWLNFVLMVTPEVYSAGTLFLPWMELGVFAGFLGLFLLSFYRFAARHPLIGIADPILSEAFHKH